MKRDLQKLADEVFDIVVVGAGIYGAAAAWDASLRGLKVALIDKNDFGSATSANSLKIIHGGLRYLQNLDFKRMRESISERRILMHIAPHLVYPMPVIMPTYSYKLKSRPAMSAALLANDVISLDRNKLPDPHKYMPSSRTMSAKELRESIPGYDKYNLNGGAMWYDCQCYNTERLLLSFILSSAEKGAEAANYVSATGLLKDKDRVHGVKAVDVLTGNQFDIRAKMVVNTAGPWVDDLLSGVNGKVNGKKFNLSSAMNIVVNRNIMGEYAGGLSGPYHHTFEDGREYNAFRILFFTPWRGRTIIGTNHLPYDGTQDNYKVTESEIQDFISAVNKAHPAANIRRDEVTYFYGGFLPMTGTNPNTGEVQLVKHYKIYDHSTLDGMQGLLTVLGVKYTTARDVAKKTIDLALERMGIDSKQCETSSTRIYGGNIDKFMDFLSENIQERPFDLNESVMRHLSYNYGSALQEILDYGANSPDLLKILPGTDEVLKAEIVHGVRKEMALKLSDVVFRRTDLGSAGNPGDEALDSVAKIMADELKWDDRKMKDEIEEVKDKYIPLQK
ncbi:MAG: glycerol-3-phosphate dehydrogenase/oxidase [candidate division KSB1 bacterium]|jgi:glycerol-3-phosphate dehydrogenase|nr:glycerol-3-phosphate dehydrogenase/oxidase [candidate division KSB1 bacterium]